MHSNPNRFSTYDQQTKGVVGKPEPERIGRQAFDTLMSLLSEDTETPVTPYGVLLANSTKRQIRKQIEELFRP